MRSTWFPAIPTPSFSKEKNSSGPKPLFETVKHCVEALQPVAEKAGLTRARLDSIVKESLMTLYDEWRDLPDGIPIDGRFVSSIIVDLEADLTIQPTLSD